MDCGANGVPRPMLHAFGVMGSAYEQGDGHCRAGCGTGEQRRRGEQGHALYKEAHQLLKADPNPHFIGNIEPRDVPTATPTWWYATALLAT